jgi:hypothetical protein
VRTAEESGLIDVTITTALKSHPNRRVRAAGFSLQCCVSHDDFLQLTVCKSRRLGDGGTRPWAPTLSRRCSTAGQKRRNPVRRRAPVQRGRDGAVKIR